MSNPCTLFEKKLHRPPWKSCCSHLVIEINHFNLTSYSLRELWMHPQCLATLLQFTFIMFFAGARCARRRRLNTGVRAASSRHAPCSVWSSTSSRTTATGNATEPPTSRWTGSPNSISSVVSVLGDHVKLTHSTKGNWVVRFPGSASRAAYGVMFVSFLLLCNSPLPKGTTHLLIKTLITWCARPRPRRW